MGSFYDKQIKALQAQLQQLEDKAAAENSAKVLAKAQSSGDHAPKTPLGSGIFGGPVTLDGRGLNIDVRGLNIRPQAIVPVSDVTIEEIQSLFPWTAFNSPTLNAGQEYFEIMSFITAQCRQWGINVGIYRFGVFDMTTPPPYSYKQTQVFIKHKGTGKVALAAAELISRMPHVFRAELVELGREN
jgi:hypothetical protein